MHFQNRRFSSSAVVPKTQARCQYVPDFMKCIYDQREDLKNFWMNQQNSDEPDLFSLELAELDLNSINYNTFQLLKRNQFYEEFPRVIQQVGEREVPRVESNPISEKIDFTQDIQTCMIQKLFPVAIGQSKTSKCNKSSE